MRTPLLLVIALVFTLLILGIATLNSEIMALSIPLMAYLFAAILRRPEALHLSLSRTVTPDYAPQDTPVTVKLSIMNEGAAIDELVVQDILPEGVRRLEGESALLTWLEPQGSIALEYSVEAHRGAYDVYEVLVRVRDFLDFFERPIIYRTTPRLVIHPRYPKLRRISIRPPQTRGFAGPIAARQGGTGIGFWAVREYQSGDPQRQINWRRSARADNQLYTNIFEQERVADVGLILDARQRANVLTASGSLFEHSVRAAAALAENFLSEGNRVSLLIYGSELARVYPGYGYVHRNRILKALSAARPGLNYALETLAFLPVRQFPARSQIVMVSPLLPDDIAIITRLRAHGYAVMIVSPDPVAYEAGDIQAPAYRLAHAERAFMLRQLRRSGVQVVDWQVEQALESAVRQTLARQPAALHINRIGIS